MAYLQAHYTSALQQRPSHHRCYSKLPTAVCDIGLAAVGVRATSCASFKRRCATGTRRTGNVSSRFRERRPYGAEAYMPTRPPRACTRPHLSRQLTDAVRVLTSALLDYAVMQSGHLTLSICRSSVMTSPDPAGPAPCCLRSWTIWTAAHHTSGKHHIPAAIDKIPRPIF